MSQKRINFLKQSNLQLLKYGSYTLTDEKSVSAVQSIYNTSINSGDTIVDAEMPTSVLGVALDWSAGSANDLIVNFSKGDYYVEQDLSLPNVAISQLIQEWVTLGTPGSFDASSRFVVKLFDTTPHIIYNVSGNNAYVKSWNGSTWETLGGGTYSFTSSNIRDFAYNSSGEVLALLLQIVDSTAYIYVKRWDGASWSNLGTYISSYTPPFKVGNSIVTSPGTEVYVSYPDQSATTTGDISVKKWDGASWSFLGSQGLNSMESDISSLLLDSSNLPVLLYNNTSTDEVEIKKWDGSSWNSMPTTGLTGISEAEMVMDSSDNIYIGYTENSPSDAVKVTKWNGSSWSQLGGTIDQASYIAEYNFITLDNDENPVIVFVSSADNKSYMKIWNGSTWENFGDDGRPGNSTGAEYKPTIDFGNNTFYVSYQDFALLGYGTVRKY